MHQHFLNLNISASLTPFPFNSFQAAIDQLKGSSNVTTAADDYLKKIQTLTEGLVQEINGFRGVALNAAKDLAVVKILVDENAGYVTVLDSNLADVLRNIHGVKMQSAGKIVSPLDTKIESIVQEKSHLNYIFPTLVALIVMFVGLFLASSLEVREKADKIAFKNLITPTSKLLFVASNFITTMLIIILQLVVLFATALFFFPQQIMSVLLPVSMVLLLMAGVFVFFGMLMGILFKSEETSLVAALSVGFILLFFSSTILPVEALPGFLKEAVAYNPFYAAQFLLSRVLIFQSGLSGLLPSVWILAGWLVGLCLIAAASKYFIHGE